MGNIDSQWNNGRTHTDQVAREVLDWTAAKGDPVYWMWVLGPTGEHKEGRAIDFMTLTANQGSLRPQMGQDIADYLWKHRERLGVWYVIYRRRIISQTRPEKGWVWMEDRGSTTANHMDHVHVSFYNNPPAYRPLKSKKKDWLEELFKNEAEFRHAVRHEVWEALRRNVGDLVWKWDHVENTSSGDKWTPKSFLSHLENEQDLVKAEQARQAETQERILEGLQTLFAKFDALAAELREDDKPQPPVIDKPQA